MGQKEIDQAQQRREERAGQPFRFWIAPGEQADIVILDEHVGPSIYEHTLKDDRGKFSINEICVKEWARCGACDTGDASYYVAFLSVIDWRGFKTRKGEHFEFSRKLLAIKQGQREQFYRFEERQGKGSLRGMHLLMVRDQQSNPRIGMPEFQGVFTEKQLAAEFSHPARKNKEGKIYLQANEMLEPFAYDTILTPPDPEALREKYSGTAAIGSTAERDEVWGKRGDNGDEEEASARTPSRRRAAEPEPDEEERPARTRTRAAAVRSPDDSDAEAPAPRRRRAAPSEEAEAPSRVARTPQRAARPAQGRAARNDPDDDIPF